MRKDMTLNLKMSKLTKSLFSIISIIFIVESEFPLFLVHVIFPPPCFHAFRLSQSDPFPSIVLFLFLFCFLRVRGRGDFASFIPPLLEKYYSRKVNAIIFRSAFLLFFFFLDFARATEVEI